MQTLSCERLVAASVNAQEAGKPRSKYEQVILQSRVSCQGLASWLGAAGPAKIRGHWSSSRAFILKPVRQSFGTLPADFSKRQTRLIRAGTSSAALWPCPVPSIASAWSAVSLDRCALRRVHERYNHCGFLQERRTRFLTVWMQRS